MARNTELLKKIPEEITKDIFQQALFLCYRDGITSIAPLGYSGDDIVLLGEPRKGQVSIRNYGGSAEMLITDMKGSFLFYGRYDINLGIDFLCEQYWLIFNLLKGRINTVLDDVSEFRNAPINPNVELSDGFEILRGFQQFKISQALL